tara:strand:- start:75 stop:785 length:711 start_codon:yes stop_codon:yes gene_type:complete
MLDDRIQQLILLQSRDRRKAGAETELEQLPEARAAVHRKIEVENNTIEVTHQAIRELEASSQKVGGEIEDLETRVNRYKTQQLDVKKSEEYKALQAEITSREEEISTLEDEQLAMLEKVDVEKASLDGAKKPLNEKIGRLEKQLLALDERENFLGTEIIELGQAYQESVEQIAPELLNAYQKVKRVVKRSPWIVPVENQRCGGCNLRVSNDVVAKALVEGQISNCDQCGRIVYFDR